MPSRHLLVVGLLVFTALRAVADEKVTFNEHIRPILSNNCFACHGSDARHREARLRLDTAEGATAERNGIQAIVPGDWEKSELWQRITFLRCG
ncbi:MAG: c-type cytochrome domain-containing protein [Opitutaceae bacterium]